MLGECISISVGSSFAVDKVGVINLYVYDPAGSLSSGFLLDTVEPDYSIAICLDSEWSSYQVVVKLLDSPDVG